MSLVIPVCTVVTVLPAGWSEWSPDWRTGAHSPHSVSQSELTGAVTRARTCADTTKQM